MIGTVLDQAQRLFGRGFLVAAFIPSFIFALVNGYLLVGLEVLRGRVNGWLQSGWQQLLFDLMVLLIGVYLSAYILYGVLAAVRNVYQGDWPWPLQLFRSLALQLQRARMVRRRNALQAKRTAVNVLYWALEFKFARTQYKQALTPEEASQLLARLIDAHHGLVERLKFRVKWEESEYQALLDKACLLQANRDQFSPDLGARIDALIAAVKQSYEAHEPLRQAVRHLYDLATREWEESYYDLHNNYPDSERWLRPTLLGNLASVQDLYSRKRYGINLGLLWPRLFHVVDDRTRASIDDANIYLDFTTSMSFLSLMSMLVALAAVEYGPPRSIAHTLLLPVLLFMSFWLFYRLTIQATQIFSHKIHAAIDLFRLKLLDALEIRRPASYAEEKLLWDTLRRYLAQAVVPNEAVQFRWVAPPEASPKDPPAETHLYLYQRQSGEGSADGSPPIRADANGTG